MTWKKYEMSTAKWAELRAKIETTGTDPEGETYATWDLDKVVAVVELGKLCKAWGVDAEGKPVCTDLSTKESIDILWTEAPVAGFASYTVNVAPGSEAHQFAGMTWE
jgi:hypothetical protein